jgi:hypothetical protein
MSLEQAIQDQTKALQTIATSLAVLVARGMNPAAAVTGVAVPAVAETKAEVKPEAKAKTEVRTKPEPKAEKPVAEKTDKELMAEVLAEDAASTVDEDDDDLLGGEDEPADDLPKLPAGTRDTAYAKANLLPVLSKLGREQVVELLGAGNKISDIPTDQWDELFEKGCKLLKAAGKL